MKDAVANIQNVLCRVGSLVRQPWREQAQADRHSKARARRSKIDRRARTSRGFTSAPVEQGTPTEI